MPTPFTHLRYAERALSDPALSSAARDLLEASLPEYLVGSVVADAQGLANLRREVTHFYTYDRPIDPMPWVIMFDHHPALRAPDDPAERAYVGGYVFHLAMDAYWTTFMTGPEFGQREWAPRGQRFLMLHLMLITMDERDMQALNEALSLRFGDAQPGDWLPFLPHDAVTGWQGIIYQQIKPGGISETFDVLAPRVGMTPAELKAVLDDRERVERDLWANVPRDLLAQREREMYAFALETLNIYLG